MGLLDIIGQALSMPTQLAQQKLSLQQQQMQMQMLQQQAPQVAGILSGIYGGQAQPSPQGAGQSAPAQTGLLPQTTQSATGPVTSSPLPSDQAQPAPQQQPGALPGLLHGAIGSINAAQPGGGLLPQPQQLSQQPQQSGLDPWQLINAGTRLQGTMLPQWQAQGKAMVAQGQAILANNPQYVTQRAVAGNQMTQDQAAIQAAQGNPMAMRAAQMKYLTDSKLVVPSNNGGAASLFGGITPNQIGMSGVNPQQGLQFSNGVESAIPGAPAAQAALAGARAGGEAAGQAPYQMEEVTDGSGNKYLVPKSQLLAPGTPGGARPAGAPTAPALAGLGPGAEAIRQGQGETANDTVKEYQEQAETGTQMLSQIDQLRAAAAQFGPGKFANVRGDFLNLLNSSGLITPTQVSALGSYQEGTKIGIQLQAAVTKQLGSREAAQVFGVMGKSIPNLTMSQDGLDKVTGYLSGMARYNMARAEYAQNQANAGNVAGVNSTRQAFIDNSNPSYYILASMSPQARAGYLQQMGPQKANALIDSWKKAATAGYAPAQPY